MSQGSTPLNQQQDLTKSLNRIWMALTAIVSIVGGIHVQPLLKPQPQPTPIVIQQTQPAPPTPLQTDPPAPKPVEIPPPIMVTDASGGKIVGSMLAGRMFFVTSAPTKKLMGEVFPAPVPDPDHHGEVSSRSDDTLVCVLQLGEKLQVIVYGDDKPVTMWIACTTSLPPPDSVLPDAKPVRVIPQKVALVSVDLLIDRLDLDKVSARVIEDFTYWNTFRDAGHDWRIYHVGKISSQEPRALSGAAAVKDAGATIPGIVIRNKTTGEVLYAGSLPATQLAMTSLLSKYTGMPSA